MKVFLIVVCILGCILFPLMSACFGVVGILVMQDGGTSNFKGLVGFVVVAAVLLFISFLLGREAKKRLSSK